MFTYLDSTSSWKFLKVRRDYTALLIDLTLYYYPTCVGERKNPRLGLWD